MMINYWHFDWIGRAWKRETLVTNDAVMCRYAYPHSHHPNREVCNKNLFLFLQRDFILLLLFDWHGWMSYGPMGRKDDLLFSAPNKCHWNDEDNLSTEKKIVMKRSYSRGFCRFPSSSRTLDECRKRETTKGHRQLVEREREKKHSENFCVDFSLFRPVKIGKHTYTWNEFLSATA